MGKTAVADTCPSKNASTCGAGGAPPRVAGGILGVDSKSQWAPSSLSIKESCLQSPRCHLLEGAQLLSHSGGEAPQSESRNYRRSVALLPANKIRADRSDGANRYKEGSMGSLVRHHGTTLSSSANNVAENGATPPNHLPVNSANSNQDQPPPDAGSSLDLIRQRLNTLAMEMQSDNAELSSMLRESTARLTTTTTGTAGPSGSIYNSTGPTTSPASGVGGMAELRRSLKTLVSEMRSENEQLESAILASYIEAQKQAAGPNPAEQMLVRALMQLKQGVQALAYEFRDLIARQNARMDEVPSVRTQQPSAASDATRSAIAAALSGLKIEGQPGIGPQFEPGAAFDPARASSHPSVDYQSSMVASQPALSRSFSAGAIAPQPPAQSMVGGAVAYQPSLASAAPPTFPVNRSLVQQPSTSAAQSVVGGPAASMALGRPTVQPSRSIASPSVGRPLSSLGLEALTRPSGLSTDLPNRGTQTFYGGRTADGLGSVAEPPSVRMDPVEAYLMQQKEPSIVSSASALGMEEGPPHVEVISAPADPDITRALADLRSRVVSMGKEVMSEPPPPPPPRPRTPPVDPTIIQALQGIRDSIKSMARAPSTDSTYERNRNEEFTNVLKEIRRSLQRLEEEQLRSQGAAVSPFPQPPAGFNPPPGFPRPPQSPLPGAGSKEDASDSLASLPLPVAKPLAAQQAPDAAWQQWAAMYANAGGGGGGCEECCCDDYDDDYDEEYDDDDDDDDDADSDYSESEDEDEDRHRGRGRRRSRGRSKKKKGQAAKPVVDEKSAKQLQRLLDMLDRCADGPEGEGETVGAAQPPGMMPPYWRPFPGMPQPFFPGMVPHWCLPPPPTCPPPCNHSDSCSCSNSAAGLPSASSFFCTRLDK